MSENLLEIFDPQPSYEQQKVVDRITDAMVVVAGPGSGKTATLVNRIINMFAHGAKPEEFFISTFTNKAADELKTRIDIACEKLYEKGFINERINTDEMWLGTLHSLFYKMLREYGPEKYADFEIIDEAKHIHKLIQRYNIANSEFKPLIKKIPNLWGPMIRNKDGETQWGPSLYNYMKNFVTLYDEIQSSNSLDKFNSPEYRDEFLYKNEKYHKEYFINMNDIWAAIKSHIDYLYSNKWFSFVDIERYLYDVLICNQLDTNNRFNPFNIKHIIVDEYQDTSKLQHKLILLLYKLIPFDGKSICVVGDDDQTLYRFRRAEVRNILNFNKEVSGNCKVERLENNYRSQKQIIDFYSKWMMTDKTFSDPYPWEGDRQKKILNTARVPELNNEFKTSVYACRGDVWSISERKGNFREFQLKLVKLIKDLKNSGFVDDYNQIALIGYTLKYSYLNNWISVFERNGIKVYAPLAARFTDNQLILTAVLSLYSCSFFSSYEQVFFTVFSINFNSCFDEIKKCFHELYDWIIDCRKNPNNHNDTISGLFYEMLAFEPFKTAINFEKREDENILNAGNLKILLDQILQFEELNKLASFKNKKNEWLNKFVNIYLVQQFSDGIEEYQIDSIAAPSGHVLMTTAHSSKGLEFPVVICPIVDELPREISKHIMRRVKKQIDGFEPETKLNLFGVPYSKEDEMEFKRKYYTVYSRAQDLLILTGYWHEATARAYDGSDGYVRYETIAGDYIDSAFATLPDSDEIFKNEGKKVSALKKSDGIKAYSFTADIAVYEQCPLRYKYMRLLGMKTATPINMLFGILVHESIEHIHKRYLLSGEITDDEQIEKIVAERYKILKNNHGSNVWFNIDRLQNIVKKYVKNNTELIKKIQQVEYKVSNVEDDFILQGNIDLITGADGNSVELLDFKTGKVPSEDSPLMQKYYHQLLTYAHLITKKNGLKVSGLKLMFPGVVEPGENNNESKPAVINMTVDKSVEEIAACADNYIKQCSEVIQKIESDDFEKRTEDTANCEYCPLIHFCKSCKNSQIN